VLYCCRADSRPCPVSRPAVETGVDEVLRPSRYGSRHLNAGSSGKSVPVSHDRGNRDCLIGESQLVPTSSPGRASVASATFVVDVKSRPTAAKITLANDRLEVN